MRSDIYLLFIFELQRDLSHHVLTPSFDHFMYNNKISYTYKIDVILKSYGSCEVTGFKCFLNYKYKHKSYKL